MVKQVWQFWDARIALILIGTAILIAFLGANIRPDQTYMANDQRVEFQLLQPGTEVQSKQSIIKSSSFWSNIGFGNPDVLFVNRTNQTQKETFWLGTDRYGRDLLSRLMGGTYVSLMVGGISLVISLSLGIFLGLCAGYFGGFIDKIILWFIQVVWSIPTLLMVMAITFVLGKGLNQVFLAVGLTMWVEVARVIRGETLRVKQEQYVLAAQTLGFPWYYILFKEILPNVLPPVIVIASANFSTAILLESGLSFLGIGAQIPTPSWGGIIRDHLFYLTSPNFYAPLLPGLAIALLVWCFMTLGNRIKQVI